MANYKFILKRGTAGVDALYPETLWSLVGGKPSTFTPTAHNHAIADVEGLTSALAGKLSTTGKAADADKLDGQDSTYFRNSENIYNPDYKTGSVPPLVKPLFDMTRPDRTAFLPADQIIIEQSIDGGLTWTDKGINDVDKRRLFTGERPGTITLPLIGGVKNTNAMIRITITGMKYNQSASTSETDRYNYWNSGYVQSTERYCTFDEGWAWVSANTDRLWCKIERATGANPNSWTNVREAWMTGWDGGNYFKLDGSTLGGGTSQTGNSWNWRITFRTATISNDFDNAKLSTSYTTSAQRIAHIKITGQNVWTAPNKLMYHDHLYGWDYLQNAYFPAAIYESNNQRVYSPNNKPSWADIQSKPSVIIEGDSRLTNARPASDVYAWAKAVNPPTPAVIGAMPTSGGTFTDSIGLALDSALSDSISKSLVFNYKKTGTAFTKSLFVNENGALQYGSDMLASLGAVDERIALLGTPTSKTSNYTFALADKNNFIYSNSISALTFTIPTNASVAFPVGSEIHIMRYGSGELSISPDSGVTLQSEGSKRRINLQYQAVTIKKLDTNTWVLIGAIKV